MSRDASQHPDELGFLNYSGALQAGDDLKVENGTTVAAAEACVFARTKCLFGTCSCQLDVQRWSCFGCHLSELCWNVVEIDGFDENIDVVWGGVVMLPRLAGGARRTRPAKE